MRKRNGQLGATLFEFGIVLFLVIAFCIAVPTCLMGNMWYTDKGVLSDIRAGDPSVISIVKTQRNVWRCSKIYVEKCDRKRVLYELDSNILFSYSAYKTE